MPSDLWLEYYVDPEYYRMGNYEKGLYDMGLKELAKFRYASMNPYQTNSSQNVPPVTISYGKRPTNPSPDSLKEVLGYVYGILFLLFILSQVPSGLFHSFPDLSSILLILIILFVVFPILITLSVTFSLYSRLLLRQLRKLLRKIKK
ncbi:hypothetical protein [Stygiolobus caldivivus]|uniref:Uncharacterized protein n=1 Tax=Stygiolobus caldivivus TaxID=2824673 RepID=A0A8D5U3Y1_9CREN|nr:hypothetical protein [Stygiolobus caldivivus]BCU68802.1 hypothetical protein KN1_00990 [Stygiolobus caldivivus]